MCQKELGYTGKREVKDEGNNFEYSTTPYKRT